MPAFELAGYQYFAENRARYHVSLGRPWPPLRPSYLPLRRCTSLLAHSLRMVSHAFIINFTPDSAEVELDGNAVEPFHAAYRAGYFAAVRPFLFAGADQVP
jgi:hypothetical protein